MGKKKAKAEKEKQAKKDAITKSQRCKHGVLKKYVCKKCKKD